jgi:hypothetical protein
MRCHLGGTTRMSCSTRTLTSIDRELASRCEHARWQAAIALGEFAESEPERIWPLVVKHGSRRHADARMAIATCVLEHILEHHFDAFFPRVVATARSSRWFHDTFRSCWRIGQAELPRNARRWRRLKREIHDLPPNNALQRKRRAFYRPG